MFRYLVHVTRAAGPALTLGPFTARAALGALLQAARSAARATWADDVTGLRAELYGPGEVGPTARRRRAARGR